MAAQKRQAQTDTLQAMEVTSSASTSLSKLVSTRAIMLRFRTVENINRCHILFRELRAPPHLEKLKWERCIFTLNLLIVEDLIGNLNCTIFFSWQLTAIILALMCILPLIFDLQSLFLLAWFAIFYPMWNLSTLLWRGVWFFLGLVQFPPVPPTPISPMLSIAKHRRSSCFVSWPAAPP